MNDLVTWLRAQLDEDEEVARGAGSDRWIADGLAFVDDSKGHPVVRDEYMGAGVQAHITRHDAARVLAEVAAKRVILTDVVDAMNGMDNQIDGEWGRGRMKPEDYESVHLIKLLALPYAGEPGYDESWRP